MRKPDVLFDRWQSLAASGQMVGFDRPIGRVTISTNVIRQNFSERPGPWRRVQFQDGDTVELPHIRNINIERDLSSDASTCSITLMNDWDITDAAPEGVDTGIGRPGYMSYNRGTEPGVDSPSVFAGYRQRGGSKFYTEWGYSVNQWADKLIPNRLIRTYQGYGSDNFDGTALLRSQDDPQYVAPEDDTQLIVTGTWLIDTVEYSGDGNITINCRDLGKVLLEQVVYPPMIPMSRFPLVYCPAKSDEDSKYSRSKNRLKYDTASQMKHEGRFKGGAIYGHKPQHAFDHRPSSVWQSHFYPESDSPGSFEWIQGKCGGNRINAVSVNARLAGFVCYVSVMEDGEWKGSQTIPYDPEHYSHSHGADIPYVKKVTLRAKRKMWKKRVHKGERKDHPFEDDYHYGEEIVLPRAYQAQKVRFTFTKLHLYHDAPDGYSVRVQALRAYYRKKKLPKGRIGPPGTISDWSDAIKELVSWAGLTWKTDRGLTGGVMAPVVEADPLIGTSRKGVPLRAWGDFEELGVGPIICTPTDYFLNKSFMESCKQIADFLGCVFFIDEYGGVVFRMPNVITGGNFFPDHVTEHSALLRESGDEPLYERQWPIEFHEGANLLDYSAVIDDSQLRSEVVVVGTNPDTNSSAPLAAGVVLAGSNGTNSAIDFTNVLAGQKRVMMVPGEQTKLFKTVEECQRMAELIGMKIMFTYRRGSAKIIGHPGLQVDDQVRIFERVTNENNVHYVSGISSTMDMESGEYTMNVTTHWLGSDPDTDWVTDRIKLTPAVRNLPAILKRFSKAGGSGYEPK